MIDELSTPAQVFVISSVVMGILVTIFGSVVYLSLAGGIVTASLWNWFNVKQFGVAPMSIPVAIGINLLINKFMPYPKQETWKDKKQAIGALLGIALSPWFILLVGWIVSLYL